VVSVYFTSACFAFYGDWLSGLLSGRPSWFLVFISFTWLKIATMDEAEITKRFNNYISTKALEGYTIVDKNESEHTCVLSKQGKKVNHILHAFLTFITLGFWLFVWLFIYFTSGKDTRIRVSYDSSGNLVEEKIKS